MSLKPGIYEQLVNKETETKLSGVDDKNKKLEDIDSGVEGGIRTHDPRNHNPVL